MKEISKDTALKDVRFSVVDIETNGLSPFKGDSEILEIALVDVYNKQVDMDSIYSTLIKPQKLTSKYIKFSDVHHITYKDVSNEKYIEELIPEIGMRLDNKVFVAHNARFDHSFVDYFFGQISEDPNMKPWINLSANSKYKYPYLDTLNISKKLFKAGAFEFDNNNNPQNSHKLDHLIYKFLDSKNIDSNIDIEHVKKICPSVKESRLFRHGALFDTYKTALILIELIELLEERNVYTISDLQEFLK